MEISDAERERLDRRHTRSGAAYERYLMGRARLRSVALLDPVALVERQRPEGDEPADG